MSVSQRDPLICSWTARLPKLPKPDSDSDSDSSDEEPCMAAPVSKFAQGNRRANPVGKSLYYPAGDLPRRWHGRRRGQPGIGYSALLGSRVLDLEVAKKWQKAMQAAVLSAESSSSDSQTMSNFYWCHIARELHSKLKKVKVDLQETNWQVREVGTRWKGVESSVKAVTLAKVSLAKTLYKKLDRILYPATQSMMQQGGDQREAARRKSSRMRASLAASSPTLPFEALSEKIQVVMRELGLEGWTAQEAHAELQQLLCKSEAQEATSRRKFRHARRRHIRQLREVFDDIDHTGDGSVDRAEFRRYMSHVEALRPHLPLFKEAESIFSSLDRRKNGTLSFADLLLLWYPYLTPKECQELAEAAPSSHEKPPQRIDDDHTWGAADIAVMQREFAALDTSGDGFVDRHEFETGMLKLWGITPQTKGRRRYVRMLHDWFSTIDVDGSGEVDFEEFQAWYVKSVADAQAAGVL